MADESVEAGIVGLLREGGHDVLYVSEMAPGMRDERVLQPATAQQRVLLTNDKDFATLAFLQRMASASYSCGCRGRDHGPRANTCSPSSVGMESVFAAP